MGLDGNNSETKQQGIVRKLCDVLDTFAEENSKIRILIPHEVVSPTKTMRNF